MSFYAVAVGKRTGIFTSWAECQDQTKGISGAVYKKFSSESEAKVFIVENSHDASKRLVPVSTKRKGETIDLTCGDDSRSELVLPKQKSKTIDLTSEDFLREKQASASCTTSSAAKKCLCGLILQELTVLKGVR